MTTHFKNQLRGITPGKGTLVHLYDTDSDRDYTLCGKWIGINNAALAAHGWGPQVPADQATCKACTRKAATHE